MRSVHFSFTAAIIIGKNFPRSLMDLENLVAMISANLWSKTQRTLQQHRRWNLPTVQPHWVHFPRAITRAWVGLLGRLWYILVEEGLTFFLRYHGPIYVDGKVFKNQVKNWKIAFLAFFVHLVKCQIFIIKYHFFYFFPFMGLRKIDTNVIGHHEFGILGTSQTFSW